MRTSDAQPSAVTEMQSICVYVPRSLADTLKAIAHAEGNRVSPVVRRLLSAAINQERARG